MLAAPSLDAPAETQRAWRRAVDQLASVQYARDTPNSYRTEKIIAQLPIERRETTILMPMEDMRVCIEYARLLVGDVYHTIALRSRQLKLLHVADAQQQPHAASAAVQSDVHMQLAEASSLDAAPAALPLPLTPSSPAAAQAHARSTPTATSARKQKLAQQQQHRGNGSGNGGASKPNQSQQHRHHPYQRA